MRNAIESWRTELSKECIAHRIASLYHKLDLEHEVDAQRKALLKVPGADDKNNAQNFFRYLAMTSAIFSLFSFTFSAKANTIASRSANGRFFQSINASRAADTA